MNKYILQLFAVAYLISSKLWRRNSMQKFYWFFRVTILLTGRGIEQYPTTQMKFNSGIVEKMLLAVLIFVDLSSIFIINF